MAADTDKVRLIFGLKVKQLRLDQGISTYELANRAGISPSYLNEIEKGKKYPKTEKIFLIAKALQTDYDALVSLKLSKKLEPIAELLNSNILSELPLEMFGIEPANFLELMSSAPAKLSAFVNTIIQIGRSYDLRVQEFYFSAVRTYQEMQENHFEDLELAALSFLDQHQLSNAPSSCIEELSAYLTVGCGYQIIDFDETLQPEFAKLRSIFIPEKKTLNLNSRLTDVQRAFTLAREVGYQHLKITQRGLVSSALESESFEEVLNNVRASYFAGAILIPRQSLIDQLTVLFECSDWQDQRLIALMQQYAVTSEVFFQRITSIMASHFEVKQLFFLRFNHLIAANRFLLTKELYLSKRHGPPASALDEHYCRRWVSLTILRELEQLQTDKNWNGEPICRAQLSNYTTSNSQYFVMSVAKASPPNDQNSSVSLGFLINPKLKTTFKFLRDPTLSKRDVNETCQRCPIAGCQVRAAAPTIIERNNRRSNVKKMVEKLRFG